MALEPGRNLGQYAIVSPLGAGGMGEVYRARDNQLGRDVAIKVLPDRITARSFELRDGQVIAAPGADDPRLAELQAEARVLASLNHPNVATLYGFEASDDLSYLVMELVEGKTLAERLRHGPLPVREAVRIFIQIADGLEAAHQRGIAHCDLKPQNVMVGAQGVVKILDFGVARVLSGTAPAAAPDSDLSPTLTQPVAGGSSGVGTLSYLSPEQARGLRGDTAADVWSFGCCLFEALTGKRAFFAATASDILVRILDREPDWEALPRETPQQLRVLLRRCLSKETASRLRHVGDAGLELRDVLEEPEEAAGARGPDARVRRRTAALRWLAAAAVGVALGATVALVMTGGGRDPVRRGVRRFSINLPADHPLQPSSPISPHRGLALSSDGRVVVYVGQSGETTQLFSRSLDSVESEPIAGTEGAWYPFFSPDDRWIGFFDRESRTLEKVALHGGLPEVLATLGSGLAATPGLGASWGADGTIVYSPVGREGLLRVSENGGAPTLVSAPPAGELFRAFPAHLPDDRGVLVMYGAGLSLGTESWGVGHVDLETGELAPLVESATMPRYLTTGHLVFSQAHQLMAAPFDLDTLSLTGPAVRVTEPRMQAGAEPWEWDVSDDGTLVFATAGESSGSGRQAAWVDRAGAETPLGMNPVADTDWARLSPDAGQIVYGSVDDPAGNWDIYLYDVEASSNRRLTLDPGFDSHPIFHPDGRRVLYSSSRQGARRIFELDLTRGGPRALSDQALGYPRAVSADGSLVFVESPGVGPTREDIGVLSRADGRVTVLLGSDARERYPSPSPDGRWLAYESDVSGRPEIYVQPLPALAAGMANGGPSPAMAPAERPGAAAGSSSAPMDGLLGATYLVSSAGGGFPLWSAAGDRIYYRQGRALVAVAVDTSDGFAVASTQVLLQSPFDVENDYFDVAADGERFLVLRPAVRGVQELIVVENWFAELERLAPTD